MMPGTAQGGIATYNPSTGQCYAAHRLPLEEREFAGLMGSEALLHRTSLKIVKEAFCRETPDPARQIVAFGPVAGGFMGRDIHEWFDTAVGQRCKYIGIWGSHQGFENLPENQFVLAPGLLYEEIGMDELQQAPLQQPGPN